MKKLLLKLSLFIIPVLIYVWAGVYIDAYNVFHVNDIRLTYVTPNQNFIKTRYILENKDRFNAFVFGSSRAGNLPLEGLPAKDGNGEELRWYNMTYAMGCPEENYQTVKTFVDNGVEIDEIVILIDEISMWRNAMNSTDDLICATYQTYEKSPLKFYYAYLKQKPLLKLVPEIVAYQAEKRDKRENFYSYGVYDENTDLEIGDSRPMPGPEHSLEYTDASTAVDSIRCLKKLCEEKDIELVVITTPILEPTYREGVENGYLEFLSDVAKVTDFYCFSGMNAYTTDAAYYFDSSHFRPFVGREMEKALFGDDEERRDAVGKAVTEKSLVDFGELVTAENADLIVGNLRHELGE